MTRYGQVVRNIQLLPQFLSEYEYELIAAKQECKVGGIIESNIKHLPGITEHRFNQLQEIEAVLNYLNIELRKIKQIQYKKYLEGYAKALTGRDAEKYAYAEDDVIDAEVLINEVALLRNKFLGIMKGLDNKQWQLGHITRLRTAGMEDITI